MAKSRGQGGQPPTKTKGEGGYGTKARRVKVLAHVGHHLSPLTMADNV